MLKEPKRIIAEEPAAQEYPIFAFLVQKCKKSNKKETNWAE